MSSRSTTHDKLRAILKEDFEWLEKHAPEDAKKLRNSYQDAMSSTSSCVDELCECIIATHNAITTSLLKNQ